MEDILKSILKKLDTIEGRLSIVESQEPLPAKKVNEPKKQTHDPLLDKALKVIHEYNEVPTTLMQEKLGVDFKRAEQILDQLAGAGYGETYMGEA